MRCREGVLMKRDTLDEAVLRSAIAARDVLERDTLTMVEERAAYRVLTGALRYAREVGYVKADQIDGLVRTYTRDAEWRRTVRGIFRDLEGD
jgi:hypothetical protein